MFLPAQNNVEDILQMRYARQILYNLTYLENIKVIEVEGSENRIGVIRNWGGGRKYWSKGANFDL